MHVSHVSQHGPTTNDDNDYVYSIWPAATAAVATEKAAQVINSNYSLYLFDPILIHDSR